MFTQTYSKQIPPTQARLCRKHRDRAFRDETWKEANPCSGVLQVFNSCSPLHLGLTVLRMPGKKITRPQIKVAFGGFFLCFSKARGIRKVKVSTTSLKSDDSSVVILPHSHDRRAAWETLDPRDRATHEHQQHCDSVEEGSSEDLKHWECHGRRKLSCYDGT